MSDKRRCIGSTTFGIEAHDAPISEFPVQPSQKDGLGRMCRSHWTEYTRALRQAATASKAAPAAETAPEPIRTLPARKRQGAQFPADGSQGDAG